MHGEEAARAKGRSGPPSPQKKLEETKHTGVSACLTGAWKADSLNTSRGAAFDAQVNTTLSAAKRLEEK